MKKGKFLFFIVVITALVAATVIARNQMQKGSDPGVRPGGQTPSAVYYCPMHPSYTSDRPGDCPICGMKLVKAETEDESSSPSHQHSSSPQDFRRGSENPGSPTEAFGDGTKNGSPREFTLEELVNMKPGEICLLHKCKMGQCLIAMTPELARLGKCPHCGEDLGVVIKNLAPEGYAPVKLNPEKQQLVGVKTAPAKKMTMTKTIRTVGRIAHDPELYQAEEEFLQGNQALKKSEQGTIDQVKDQASRLADSSKIKLKLLGLSDDLIAEIAARGKPDRSLLYSEPGGTVWLYAPIYEYEIPYVKVGDGIEAEAPSTPGNIYRGKVRSLDPVLDPMTRSVRARAILENPNGFLKPEMYVNAVIKIDLGEVLAVPEEAVFKTGERDLIFVARPDGVFEPREVVLGAKSEGFSEIKYGASEGENVVTSGNFLIDSESRLKAALESAAGGGGHQH